MKVTATALRQNIYALLDQALSSGEPIEVERKGQTLTRSRPGSPNSRSETGSLATLTT
jgi:antitoxin (DNA-binding transcriptional repressor) of toxin-antitoxin stability system